MYPYDENNNSTNTPETGSERPAEDGSYRIVKPDAERESCYRDASYTPQGEASFDGYYVPGGRGPKGPEPEKKHKKHGLGVAGIVALCLVCALLGGVSGGLIANNSQSAAVSGTDEPSNTGTLVQESPSASPNATGASNSGEVMSAREIYYDLALQQVVGIQTDITKTNIFGMTVSGSVSGSGFVISSDGYILTNYHVVASIQGLYVGLPDSGQAEAVLVGSDPETDLALIKISGESGLPFIGLGDTSKLKVGQSVLAIGNPFDVGQTVTSGIISALGRHGLGLNSYEDFIQTDAAINQGNSGGALVNTEGELIGINTAIFSPEQSDGFIGIGFAIPSSIISRVLPSLMEGKTVERGYLGFVPRQLSREFAMDLGLTVTRGVMVSHVLGKSPAGRAGPPFQRGGAPRP